MVDLLYETEYNMVYLFIQNNFEGWFLSLRNTSRFFQPIAHMEFRLYIGPVILHLWHTVWSKIEKIYIKYFF